MNLSKFTKPKVGAAGKRQRTSVNLDKSHMDFVKRKNLNLSSVVRDCLNRLMKDDSK